MSSLPRIYCDMDGVLCDFKKGAEEVTGISINSWMLNPDNKLKWKPIMDTKDFWATLPWMPGGQQLWNFIKPYNPHILSAYVEHVNDPNCISGKRKWLKTHLGISDNKINLVKRKQKQNFALYEDKPAILIDDYIKNTSQFQARGGIGITHISTAKTINQLKKLGFK